jgi:hypothetical protein
MTLQDCVVQEELRKQHKTRLFSEKRDLGNLSVVSLISFLIYPDINPSLPRPDLSLFIGTINDAPDLAGSRTSDDSQAGM